MRGRVVVVDKSNVPNIIGNDVLRNSFLLSFSSFPNIVSWHSLEEGLVRGKGPEIETGELVPCLGSVGLSCIPIAAIWWG